MVSFVILLSRNTIKSDVFIRITLIIMDPFVSGSSLKYWDRNDGRLWVDAV